MKRILLVAVVGLSMAGCANMGGLNGLNPNALRGGELGFSGNVMGYGVTVKAVVEITAPSTNVVPPIVPPAPTPIPTPAPAPGAYVSQWPAENPADVNNAADHGPEIVGVFNGVDYRFVANDNNKQGYFISVPASAFILEKLADGSVRASATDFIGASGAHFRWQGFRVASSSSTMLTANPQTVAAGDWKGTFRGYWLTVQ